MIGNKFGNNDVRKSADAGAASKDRDRKSSSNIEEVYSEDGFEEESLGNS